MPSADGKQITSSIKGLLSVHGHIHEDTRTHSLAQDNKASAGARVRDGGGGWVIQGVEDRGEVEGMVGVGGWGGYGTTPHKGSPEIAPSHNETCHSVYEIMSN